MCIIFLYQNNDETSHYKLIMAANRDEYMHRPTKAADYMSDLPHVLCGMDMEAGGGGTWLGVNKYGKFAALTNVMVSHEQDSSAQSRGHIVMDYLKNIDPPLVYAKSLESKNFREYNALVGSVKPDGKIETAFFSNCDGLQPRLLDEDVITVACTSLNGNWRKMTYGRQKFEEMLPNLKNHEDEEFVSTTLVQSLLSDTTCLYPDENIKKMAMDKYPELFLKKYCSVKIVDIPEYGTRMQTVVLINKNNEVFFLENSLAGSGEEAVWKQKSYKFKIETYSS